MIRLCGAFKKASKGEGVVRPFYDVFVEVDEVFAEPRPAGRSCYDVDLIVSDPSMRADAITFRALDAIGMAIDCEIARGRALPVDLNAALASIDVDVDARLRTPPGCNQPDPALIGDKRAVVEYQRIGAHSFRVCGQFARAYDYARDPSRLFDPRMQSRFLALAEARPEVGRRCYEIATLRIDPVPPATMPYWPDESVGDAGPPNAGDKRAIGEVVNMLRAARCAYTFDGVAPDSFDEAIAAIASRSSPATKRYHCEWAPSYFGEAQNRPLASYSKLGADRAEVCADFERAWPNPLALNYYAEVMEDWPTSLPEFQRPVTGPGRACYVVRLTRIGSGEI